MAPTSKEEISRQHEEAVRMVEGYADVQPVACAPHNDMGEISLKDKTQPTHPFSFYDDSATCATESSLAASSSLIVETTAISTICSISDSDDSDSTSQPMKSQPSLLNPTCWSTRGRADVTNLQNMVREGYNLSYINYKADNTNKDDNTNKSGNYESKNDDDDSNNTMPSLSSTNYWDPRNAAKHNVTLSRPSHDVWGIGKIVLIFSDDFVTRVYQFPWWKDFEESIQPILDVIFPSQNSKYEGVLVRALLASLPPGSTIPVHHDTGEWVKKTHRIHIPVLVEDPSKVLFQVGPASHMLQRIDCIPGLAFEINNQAKHAVSNCSLDYRVHLILDYIVQDKNETTSRITPVVLEPGEQLFQTRRSVDRLKDMVPRPTPSYIILGAQKAGTTSLYHYINEHPWIVKSRRRETHCLDWRWDDRIQTKRKQLEYCQKFFFTDSLKNRPSCLTGDSTPSYLLDSRRVIPRLKRIFDWKMKFFVIMRDPVQRAISHYSMVTSPDGTSSQLKTRGSEWRNKSLSEVIQMELANMNDCGLIPYWNMEDGTVDQVRFDQFTGSLEEDEAWNIYLERYVPLNTGSYGLLTRGMYAVQIRPWFRSFDRDQFLFLRLESLMEPNGVRRSMKRVFNHLDLPYHTIKDESAKNNRDYEPIDVSIRDLLRRFFEPHNLVLSSVLNKISNNNISDKENEEENFKNPWSYA